MATRVATALGLKLLSPGKSNICESSKGTAIIKSARTSAHIGILKSHLDRIRIIYGVLVNADGGAEIFEVSKELFEKNRIDSPLEKNAHLWFMRTRDVRRVGELVLSLPSAPSSVIEAAPTDHRPLFKAYNDSMKALLAAGLIRSTNNPLGDYGEYIVAQKLKLTLSEKSAKGFDATDEEGAKYQIESRRPTPGNPSRQLGGFRDLDKKLFDFCLAAIFDPDFNLIEVWKIPHSLIRQYARDTTRGFKKVILDGKLLREVGVLRII